MNVHELMEYGPIVANDPELDLLITVNGAYFNLWAGDGAGNYTNTDAYDMRSRVKADNDQSNGLYGTQTTDVMDAAERLLAEILEEGTCDYEGCMNPLDDGEGWNGLCGEHADMAEEEEE